MALTDWVIAPIFMYVCGGMTLFILYTSLSLFVRYVQNRKGGFIAPVLWLFLILRFIPMILTSLFIIIASAFTSGGRPVHAIRGLFKGSIFDLDICVMAYAQNLVLGGAFQNSQGQKIERPWYGPEAATAKIMHHHVMRVVMHYGIILLLFVVFMLV